MAEESIAMVCRAQQRSVELWDRLTEQYSNDKERGEVTATTALIFLLVIAAITAGTIIAAKVVANAENIPQP